MNSCDLQVVIGIFPPYMKPAKVLFFLGWLGCASVSFGHDLMASVCRMRVTSDRVELQIKAAAETIWPLVQESVAPGAVFVLEDFETVGKAWLVAFARTMEEVTIKGANLSPRGIDVAVVEDNFVFTLIYDRAGASAVRLKENYLTRMPPGYLSRVVLLNQQDEVLAAKTLRGSDIVFEIPLTAGVRPTSGPAGSPGP